MRGVRCGHVFRPETAIHQPIRLQQLAHASTQGTDNTTLLPTRRMLVLVISRVCSLLTSIHHWWVRFLLYYPVNRLFRPATEASLSVRPATGFPEDCWITRIRITGGGGPRCRKAVQSSKNHDSVGLCLYLPQNNRLNLSHPGWDSGGTHGKDVPLSHVRPTTSGQVKLLLINIL